MTPQGVIYVKLNRVKDGKGILVLHSQANGKAAVTSGFGDYGGTGMYVKSGYLYASSDHDVYRYKLDDRGEVVDPTKGELLVRGLKV
ncbi:MAG: sorbosone dehydrogenase, partial [Hymenobacter sp.]